MLVEAFGLRQDPFLDTADPAFYFETIACAHARRRLTECLAQGRGLALVVGPVGAGKTTLCNAAQQNLVADNRYLVGLILDPTFESESELLAGIAASFGFDQPSDSGSRARKEQLKRGLFAVATEQNRQAVLFIDEAQLMKEELLETLRALLNFQLDDRKLLSIAVFGQMELEAAVVRRPNLRDRVALWLALRPLAESEAAALLDHRLRCAGYAGAASPFDARAASALWRHSGGLPRRLTSLAREAMEIAAEVSRRVVTLQDVELAVGRLGPIEAPQRLARDQRPWWRLWRAAS